jgi:hypothetical protein
MKIGTKSILFGAHQFLLHPVFVAWAWIKLYGFPWDPRVWIAFFVHDLGYWGKPNMDGVEGETHVELGARIMHFLFDGLEREELQEVYPSLQRFIELRKAGWHTIFHGDNAIIVERMVQSTKWRDFTMYHSRYYAKKNGAKPSKLCFADKLAFSYFPRFMYIPMVSWTGEIVEYMKTSSIVYPKQPYLIEKLMWYDRVERHNKEWVAIHIDGKVDTWTNGNRNNTDPLHVLREDTFTNEETNEMVGRGIRENYVKQQMQ